MESLDEEDYEYEYNITFNESYEYYHTLCYKDDVRNFGKIFLPIFYSLALIIGISGNSLVVAVYIYYKRLKTKTDIYILNLAIADLLLLFTLPFWAADAVHGWELGEAMCKITSALYVMNFSCGMFFLACISLDRYQAMFRNQDRPRKQEYIFVLIVVWMAAIILSLPQLIFSTVKEKETRRVCISVYPATMARNTKAAIQFLEVIFSFVIPFVIMVFCYTRVAKTLMWSPNVKKWRAFRVLLAVVGVFFLTQIPYNIVKFIRAVDVIYSFIIMCEASKNLDIAILITESAALFHSCLNPIVYAFVGASVKNHLLKLLKMISSHKRTHREQTVEISLNSHSNTENTISFTI
ncbi:atypical chemokine receptor 4-like [Polypterus senegalus]